MQIIEYCTHHRNDIPITANGEVGNNETTDSSGSLQRFDDTDEWDSTFIRMDNEELFDVILAANYLDIKDLLDLGCKEVASKLKGKTPEQIRALFNIENDFTPEEEAQIRQENSWAVE
jgi:S-phase kinase-associated protein 1